MSSSASLSIRTYHRGHDFRGEIKPYHWALFIRCSDHGLMKSYVHQLRGCPGAFYYPGVDDGLDLVDSHTLNNELEIGAIPISEIGQLEERLRTISIDLYESTTWNCQDWAMEAVKILTAGG